MKEGYTTLQIEKVVSKGEGLARDGNKIWFVPFTLPDEKVVATPHTLKKQFIKGELVEIITPSTYRVTPFCPYYEICGGCDFQHISYLEGVKLKEKIILENLQRLGGIDSESFTQLPPITGEDLHYRHRVKFSVDQRKGAIGFLARGTHDVVDINSCPLLSSSLNALLQQRKTIWDRVKEIEPFSRNRVITISAFEGDDGIVTLDETPVNYTLLDVTLRVNANVFFQSNKELLQNMALLVKKWSVGNRIIDLFSGIGTFASVVEGVDKEVFAVERDKKCIHLAQKHLKHTKFITQDAAHWMKSKVGTHIDTLILDPPRVGLESSMIDNIHLMKPHHLIYISCDSATFARDASLLKKVGYNIDTFVFVDMYPHTSHTETMALFTLS